MPEVFEYGFMQRALLVGVLVGLLSSYYGVFVVERGLSFLGSGLAHAAFGGIALGILLGMSPLWVALPFTLLVACGILWVQERGTLSGDTAIGIFFSLAMALGVIFLALSGSYTVDAFSYLFGSILAVTAEDVWLAVGVTGLALATVPSWQRWAYATYDEELAQSDRVPVRRDTRVLVMALAITIVVAAKVVGIVLIAAFLVIPAAAARLVSRTFAEMTLGALGVGLLTVLSGMLASYALDLPTGPVIILAQTLLFGVALAIGRSR